MRGGGPPLGSEVRGALIGTGVAVVFILGPSMLMGISCCRGATKDIIGGITRGGIEGVVKRCLGDRTSPGGVVIGSPGGAPEEG